MVEWDTKLSAVRRVIAEHGLGGIRLRGTDWFSWATCGGSNVVLLSSEVGVAEVWVTAQHAWVLTDEIESERLKAEELPSGVDVWAGPWAEPQTREAFVQQTKGDGPIASDRPGPAEERGLPDALVQARSALLPEEVERYRALGRDAAAAMTDTLLKAKPEWTEWQLAAAGAKALLERGIHPALVLAGGERRLPLFRHTTPTHDRLNGRAMLVFCGRRHGLFANLTRFVSFRAPTSEEQRSMEHVAEVEAAALDATRPGARLSDVYDVIVRTYAALGHAGAERHHHQGGSCGYLSRDVIARPDVQTRFQRNDAAAWNPSLPGAKIEDTVLVTDAGVEVLTVDPRWPTREVHGRRRPWVLS